MIKTKNKGKFLRQEFKEYLDTFKDYKEFIKVMGNDVRACRKCKMYYWWNSSARCTCFK